MKDDGKEDLRRGAVARELILQHESGNGVEFGGAFWMQNTCWPERNPRNSLAIGA
jgi:hypothetical protein